MAINYTTLTGAKATAGSIKNWCNSGAFSPADIVTEAEAWIYERLRATEMREEATWSAAIGASSVALESDFIAPIKLFVDGGSSEGLQFLHEELFDQDRDADGAIYTSPWPSHWTVANNLIQFDVKLSEARAGDLWYYERPEALATAETNFLTTNHPTLLRRACMMFGYEYLKRWDAFERTALLAEQALELANQYADNSRRGQEF